MCVCAHASVCLYMCQCVCGYLMVLVIRTKVRKLVMVHILPIIYEFNVCYKFEIIYEIMIFMEHKVCDCLHCCQC